jgi:hypothetical protein
MIDVPKAAQTEFGSDMRRESNTMQQVLLQGKIVELHTGRHFNSRVNIN